MSFNPNAGDSGPSNDENDGFDLAAFMKSPAGAALISSIGGGLSAYGANKSAAQDRALSANQFAAGLYQRQNEDNAQNAQGVLSASPLGGEQRFAGSNALMAAILPGLRNQHTTPSDSAVAAAMPTRTGGLRLPEEGLDPNMINAMFGPEATMSSLASRAKNVNNLDPHAQSMDLTKMFGNSADSTMSGINDFRTQRLADHDNQQALIQRAIDNDLTGTKQKPQGEPGSGFWHKLAKYGGMIGGYALAPYTGGASIAAGNALSAWGSGAGVKSALGQGALSYGMSKIPTGSKK